jgi:hypothetical protein
MPKVLAVIQVIEKRRAECHERPQEAEGPLVYSLRTSFVLPRPIAWVTSVGQTGVRLSREFGTRERNLRRAVGERRLVQRLNPGSVGGFQKTRKPTRETGLAG